MSWPLSQDYNEAIQDPRGNFSDVELKTGEAVANALGIPMPRSGNFADVYEVRCPSGARWAVKCFTREVHGLRERYAEISNYLRQANLPFMVDFQYLEQGIRVRGQWFPVLKMQWVEGFVLNEFVRDNLDKKPILQALGQIWLRMARRLRKAQLAHCDLQHGNVLFVPGSTANSLAVKLIDYDGMCVPSLAGKNSGEVGHPAYQHPERLRTGAYNQEVDRFSLLSIAAALRCLTIGGRSLWERYDNGDNLLFRQADLQAPAESLLFQELLAMGDPQAQTLVKELYRACQGPLAAVPLLTDLLPEEKPAGKVMTAAARQAAAAEGTDWDFSDEETDAPIVRKRRASAGMPLWLWGALGGAAALLLSVGAGAGLFLHKAPDKKEGTPIAQNRPAANSPNPTPKPQPSNSEPQLPNNEPQPPNNSVDPPPKPDPVEEKAREQDLPAGIFCLTPTGDKLAISDAGGNTWRLLDPRTNQLLQRFTGHTGPITALAFSADGRRAVTSGGDGMLRLWDVQTGQMIGARPTFGKPVVGIALSPDGNKAATVDGSVHTRLWDFETKRSRSYNHSNRKTTSVAFSPDGRYLVLGFDESDKVQDEVLILWPLIKGVGGRGYRGPSKAVSCIAVSPDGKYIAAGHAGDARIVSLWETTGRPVRQFTLTIGPFHQVAFSPDGRFLLVSAEKRSYVWLVEQGKGVMGSSNDTQIITEDRITAAFTPDSERVMFVYRKADRVARIQTVRLPRADFPGTQRPAQVRTAYLADLREERVTALSFAKRDGSKLNNNASPNNLFTHPSDNGAAQVIFNLGKKYSRFKATVGIRDGANGGRGSVTPLTFRVLGDDKELWKSAPIQRCGDTRDCTVSVAGVERLELRVDCPGAAFCAHAVWAEPRLEEDNPSPNPVNAAPAAVVVKPPPRPRPRRFSNKMAVPNEQTQDDKRKLLRVMYRDDYKSKSKRALAAQMLQDSKRQGDLALSYVMLNEAGDLAAREGDLDTALRAASELGMRFAVDPLEAKCHVLEETLPNLPTKSKDKFRLLTHKALLFVDRAVIDEDFDCGEHLLEVAKTAAAKADASTVLVKMVNQQAKQFTALREGYDAVKRFVDKLETDPNDADANLALGRFRCFIRNDWDAGLPLLVKGGDKALSELAQKDVAGPADPAARAALGDAWSERADKLRGKEQDACRRRAYFWYQDCLDDLDAKGQMRVNARLKKLTSQLADGNNPFHDLDIGVATLIRKTGILLLRLAPQQRIATRQLYRGPIDIRVTALLPKNHIRITFLNGGEMSLSPRDIRAEVKYYGHYAADPDKEGGSWGPSLRSTLLPPNSLQQIRILATRDHCTIWINGKQVLSQGSAPPFSSFAPSPVRVWSDDGEVDVKSLVVKRVR